MGSKRKKTNNKQNVELFKFFENTKQRKTSPKSKNDPQPMMFKLGQRRSTRLKTEIFVENFPETLPDGEYDISKEDFETTDIPPLKKKIKLSEVDDSTSAKNTNDTNKKNLDRDESIIGNNKDHSDFKKTEKSKSGSINININNTQQMADNLIDTIDTNVIAEILQDTSLDMEDSKKRKRKRKYNENSEQCVEKATKWKKRNSKNSHLQNSQQHVDFVPSDSELHTDNSDFTNIKLKSKKKNLSSTQNNTELEHSETLLDTTQSDRELQTANDFTNKKSKKKERKSIQNTINTNLNVSEQLVDITQSDNEHRTDSDIAKNKLKSKQKECKSKQNNTDDSQLSDVQNENSIKLVDITQSDSELQTDSILTEKKSKSKKKKRKSIDNTKKNLKSEDLGNTNSADKFKKSNKKQNVTNSNANDLENNLYDDNPKLFLTVSDEDDMEINSKNKNLNAEETQNNDLENTLYDNNPQLSLTFSTDDNDLEKSSQSISQDKEIFSSTVDKENENSSGTKSKETNTSNIDANNLVQPIKRGRKPKVEKNNLLKYFTVQEKQSNESKDLQNETTESNLDENLNKDNNQISANENSAAISDKKTTRSRKSNTSTTANAKQDKSVNSEKTPKKRGRPKLEKSVNSEKTPRKKGRPKSEKPKVEKPRVVKVNMAKEVHKKAGVTKMSKVTKEQIKQGKHRKIPKERLEEILEIIDDIDHPIWEDRNISCNPGIQTFWEIRNFKQSELNMKLKYARQFLLRRDWPNLMKIICLCNKDTSRYYPLLAKYAALLLAHTDSDQFDKFIQFLTNMTDSSAVVKKCTKISNNNEE